MCHVLQQFQSVGGRFLAICLWERGHVVRMLLLPACLSA